MTKYIEIKTENDDVILEVAEALKAGKIVVFKTDTVYGMGANALDEEACRRIYKVKGRPANKPLCVLISDILMLDEVVDSVSSAERRLIETFWPGPLTIKLRKKVGVFPDIISAGDEFVRVRLLGDGLARDLVAAAGVPVVAPSANLSGSHTGVKIEEITRELGGKVDYVLDEGDVEDDTTSTIVQVSGEQAIVIREGKIEAEEIAKVVPLKK